ncbi:hypothetical protein KUTeg_008808 [Tegillarca granosa]|uniref:Uncharacterized protein n=1 Tax=Tegillarca granosa TaxID=220873 RepID=A0ABQ9FEI2_TEGGR|nr:hypothetical protein KUTeg_008808 [Tegillarca granosa]
MLVCSEIFGEHILTVEIYFRFVKQNINRRYIISYNYEFQTNFNDILITLNNTQYLEVFMASISIVTTTRLYGINISYRNICINNYKLCKSVAMVTVIDLEIYKTDLEIFISKYSKHLYPNTFAMIIFTASNTMVSLMRSASFKMLNVRGRYLELRSYELHVSK